MSAEFNHQEAFCFITYECKQCKHRVNIWNSHDAIAPYMVKCRYCKNGAMVHVNWKNDAPSPHYRAKLGDLVFITLTKEEYVELQKEYAKQIWITDEGCRNSYENLEEFQTLLSSVGYREGSPAVREVVLAPWKRRY